MIGRFLGRALIAALMLGAAAGPTQAVGAAIHSCSKNRTGKANGAARRHRCHQTYRRRGHDRRHGTGRPLHGPPAATVAAAPLGPSGSWAVEYADAFARPFGTGPGEDNTLQVATNGNFTNSNEIESFDASKVLVGEPGLMLICKHEAKEGRPYTCGNAEGKWDASSAYHVFKWSPGHGQDMVFECYCKLPPNTGHGDPAFWSHGPPWDNEVDHPEWGGWDKGYANTDWNRQTAYFVDFAPPHPELAVYELGASLGYEPDNGLHRWTTELYADGHIQAWVDGHSLGSTSGTSTADATSSLGLVIDYGLRSCTGTAGCSNATDFETSVFTVRSVAVYEDSAHAGVAVTNAGLAPGTSVR